MKHVFGAAMLLAAVSPVPAVAQEAPVAVIQVPATAPAAPAATRALPPSTQIVVTPTEEISSKHVEEGQRVNFVTVGDVVDNGAVVIPRGSAVQATITWKTGRAIGGKSGKFEVTFNSVTVRGQDYPLRGMHRQEGRGNTLGAVLGSILISGRSAVMLPGQEVTAFTATQIPY
ncbi:hypothetical protein [Qipengyuania sp. YIM B01966]|uniref:hypothetical protein n=1 Tax=Qipengyuania sp. YIM B01966 TaxID=2778646 RepID=UPI0018F79709|nr:hypothetical protein [Qipengyuania sp. YIM B01966]